MTRLYLLSREPQMTGEAALFVVRAKSTEEARRLASQKAGAEGKDCWLHINKSTCTELAHEGESGVVARSHAERR